jgi:hypothetical protein
VLASFLEDVGASNFTSYGFLLPITGAALSFLSDKRVEKLHAKLKKHILNCMYRATVMLQFSISRCLYVF